jgi:hypothetical protein
MAAGTYLPRPSTAAEKQRILDEGSSLALCTTCAAEAIAIGDEDSEEGEASY